MKTSILAYLEIHKPNSIQHFFDYDIALITLRNKPFKSFKQTIVRPICLPDPKVIPSDINKLGLDEDITIIGMGSIGKKGTKKNINPLKLQYAEMKRVSPDVCLRKWGIDNPPSDFDSTKGAIKYS